MSHSLYKIWLHIVFSTHRREPMITPKLEPFIFRHIRHMLIESGCYPLAINGMPDHIHLLIQMNPNKSIAEIVKQVKGTSSHTINRSKIIKDQFAWQTGYGVFSVSESQLEKVRIYIFNQKKHHTKISFSDEIEKFTTITNYAIPSNP